MINRLNLMLPTYGRAKTRLPVFISTALEKADDKKQICFTFVVNAKDIETIDVIHALCDNVVLFDIIFETTDKPNLSTYFNMAYTQTVFKDDETAVSMLGDDMEFATPGYDSEIIKWMNMFDGLGVFFCDDAKGTGDALCVNLFTSRKYVDGLKPLPFMCEMFPCDDMDVVHYFVAKELGVLYYLEHVKIFHNHSTLPGKMDEVWKRLREVFPEVQKNRTKGKYHGYEWGNREYEADCVANLKKNIPELSFELGVLLTTKDRVGLLSETVDSYNNAVKLPEILYVFDDKSNQLEKVVQTVSRISGATMRFNSTNFGVDKNNISAIQWMLANTTREGFIVLDSDCLLHRYWYQRAKAIYLKLSREHDLVCASLFNVRASKGPPDKFGLVEKDFLGGITMIFSRNFAENYIGKSKDPPWDTQCCMLAAKDGVKIYCSSPSFVQHLGYDEGTHIGCAKASVASDALPTMRFNKNLAIGASANRDVLFALPARYGDIILGSFVVNMLREKEYPVTWLVAYYYEDLVRLVCPGVKIVCCGNSRSDRWFATSTKEMRDRYPGYGFYINAQPGSPEHHDRLMKSGQHMAWFVKSIVEAVIGEKLPDNFINYAWANKFPPTSVDRRDNSKPLCLISPEVISIPTAITPAMVDQWYEKYSGQYDVKILTEKPPESVEPRIRRARHTWGHSFIQCFDLLQQAALFIGNDSGLAWVSLFSRNCKKIIYHHKCRMAQTNVRYHDIDPLAEDVIV